MLTESLFILFFLSLVLFLCYFFLSFFTGAPFVPTPMSVVHEMIRLAKIDQKTYVYDLGSGDGRMLIESARKGARSKGWEINPFLVIWTILHAYRCGVSKNVTVYCQTYQKANLDNATVVFLYNIPLFLPALEKKLHRELKPGTRVISYKFPLRKYKLTKQTKSGIYLYTVK